MQDPDGALHFFDHLRPERGARRRLDQIDLKQSRQLGRERQRLEARGQRAMALERAARGARVEALELVGDAGQLPREGRAGRGAPSRKTSMMDTIGSGPVTGAASTGTSSWASMSSST